MDGCLASFLLIGIYSIYQENQMEECPYIRRVAFLFHSRTVDSLRCDIYNGEDRLIGQAHLNNCKIKQFEFPSDERRFYCLFISECPQIEEYFSFRVEAVLDEALKATRNKQYSEFSLKVEVDVGFRDYGNPFSTQAELNLFIAKHLKKLEQKTIKKLDVQSHFRKNRPLLKNTKGQVLRTLMRSRTVFMDRGESDRGNSTVDQETTLDISKKSNTLIKNQEHKKICKTLKRLCSRDEGETSNIFQLPKKRKASVLLSTTTIKLKDENYHREKQPRMTEPIPTPKEWRTYLEKKTITEMQTQKETISFMREVLRGKSLFHSQKDFTVKKKVYNRPKLRKKGKLGRIGK